MAEYHRECPECGDSFVAKNTRGVYCSKNCWKKQYYRKHGEKERRKNRARYSKNKVLVKAKVHRCLWCGNQFITKNTQKIFCSQMCKLTKRRVNAYGVPREQICPCCKNLFIAKRSNSVYCSKQCYSKNRRRANKEEIKERRAELYQYRIKEINERRREHRQEHLVEARDYAVKYRREHREKIRARERNYRRRVRYQQGILKATQARVGVAKALQAEAEGEKNDRTKKRRCKKAG